MSKHRLIFDAQRKESLLESMQSQSNDIPKLPSKAGFM